MAQTITTIAGNGTSGTGGDGSAANVSNINNITTDYKGNIYFTTNTSLRKIAPNGIITKVAGSYTVNTFGGDGGAAATATFNFLSGVAVDKKGNIYLGETYRLRKIGLDGIIRTIAGTGSGTPSGDGGPAPAAALNNAAKLKIDIYGNIYLSDFNNLRKIDTNGYITRVAGTSASGTPTVGSSATATAFAAQEYTIDSVGNIYFTNYFGNRVYKISGGYVSLVAGTGTAGFSGDGGQATAATLNGPGNIELDLNNNLLVADQNNNRIRKITPSGIISTYAGNGSTTSGSGGAATSSGFSPAEITVDYTGNLIIYDVANYLMKYVYCNAGTITAPAAICNATSTTLTASVDSGRWATVDLSIATVSSSGRLFATDTGMAYVFYFSRTGCGSTAARALVHVDPIPDPGRITGADVFCAGSSFTMAGTTSAGTYNWSSSNPSIASINPVSGLTTGLSTGVTTISYSTTNIYGCTTIVTKNDTIINRPALSPISGPSTVCPGAYITLNDTVRGGTWYTSNSNAILTSATTGTFQGITPGADTITYTVSNICGTSTVSKTVTVNPNPVAGTIFGSSTVCTGTPITFSTTGSGGSWSSSATAVASVSASGVVYGISAGSAVISYSVTNTCGTAVATYSVTVAPTPRSTGIYGTTSICTGSYGILYDSIAGGTWVSGNTSVANIYSSGVYIGSSSGTANIFYIISNSCGIAVHTTTVTVSGASSPVISGHSSICVGNIDSVSASVAGGTWSSSNSAIASVNSTGRVYGVSAGSAIISYNVTTSCGSSSSVFTLTVNTGSVSPISGASTVCERSSITLSDSTAGGAWSSSNPALASVSATGTVTGISAGPVSIAYVVANSCGTFIAYNNITVAPLPYVSGISGATTVCAGSTTTLTDTAVGTWSSSAPTIATISMAGVVSGLAGGNVTITFTKTNSCGTATTTAGITVIPVLRAAAISGPSTACVGTTISLSDSTTGGFWSIADPAIATIDSAGRVTGRAAGSTTVVYVLSNSCGTSIVYKPVTITAPYAAPVTGATSLCRGTGTAFSSATTGGVWSSSDTAILTIDAAGNATARASGSATISYAVASSCGSATATSAITITSAPDSVLVTGAATVCQGATLSLSATPAGGSWSATPPSVATISASGTLYGLAPGTDTVAYTVSNSCGTRTGGKIITVMALPSSVTITGAASMFAGVSASFTASVTGGTWSSTNPAVASVTASGVVRANAAGTDTIKYTYSNSCGSTIARYPLIVTTATGAGTISGPAALCVGSTATLTSTVAGGSWTSSGPTVASVVSTTGVVRGNAAGVINITYTVGTTYSTYRLTINNTTLASIAGAATVCPGASTTFTNSTSGGTWSNDFATRGSISSSGSYTSISSGVDTIRYTLVNACGTFVVKKVLTVTSPPSAGSVSGASATTCPGRNITFTNSTTGGVWTFSNPTVATIASVMSPSVVVTGLTAGIDTLSYTVTGTCGLTSTVRRVITVNPTPTVGSGSTATVLIGGTITLTNSVSGGTWSTVTPAIASVAATTGIVRGRAAGLDTIKYAVTNTCGTATAIYLVSVTASKAGGSPSPEMNDDIHLYPNPATGMVYIELSNEIEAGAVVSVTNMAGKVLYTSAVTSQRTSVDMSEMPSGMYLIHLQNGQHSYMVKLLKQ